MYQFFEAILFAFFAATVANSSVKPTKSDNADNETNKAKCIVNNNFHAGSNSKKIEQQLAEMRQESQEIRAALKGNRTGSSHEIGLLSDVKQQLAEIKEIVALNRGNKTGDSHGTGLFSEVKQQLVEIKEEIKALKRNQTGDSCRVYKNCAEIYQSGNKLSGVYKIDPDGLGEFKVFCDQKTTGGGWTVFQKRQDGSIDFFRAWDDYKRGFGNLNGEFWLGLDKIHRLTVNSNYKLRVDLEVTRGTMLFAEYSSFAVTNERSKYQLSLGTYSGTAGDSLGPHRGRPFSTKDRDNDKSSSRHCASTYKGAWWYHSCYSSNLNGIYFHGKINHQGITWEAWPKSKKIHPHYSVKRSEMKIRPKDF